MTLPSSTVDRENQKFVEDAGGNVAVRTDLSSSSGVASYQVNDMDDGDTATDVLYVGLETSGAAWCVFKFDETTSALPTKQYATVTNNSGTTTYSTAWTGRAALTFADYSVAF